MLHCRNLLAAGLLCLINLSMVQAVDPMLRLDLDGQAIEGKPLFTTANFGAVLARDGRMWRFDPNDARNLRKTTIGFRGYSITQMKAELRREFDRRFEVSSTGHYVVVHPRGNGREWSARFEELYRSFWHYFQVRGFRLEQPEFPLVAIIFSDRDDFLRYAQRQGDRPRADSPGYYSPTSNRVALYDISGPGGDDAWDQNRELIIHEATHQTAYNTGIHSRTVNTPRWVSEGLATLFEAEGVWNSRRNTSEASRINRGQLERFQEYVKTRRPKDALPQILAYDNLFQRDAWAAYAEAWALTFYLVETQPRKYAEYLRRTKDRPDFSTYPAADRLDDFTTVFGKNLELLDAKYVRHMMRVK